MPLTAGPWRRSKRRSPNRANGTRFSRLLRAKNDRETIAGWKSELNRILHVFNVRSAIFTWSSPTVPFQTELAMNTHTIVSDIRRNILKSREGTDGQHQSVSDTCAQFIAE
jgi:hypothetical protein